jgi:DNA repair protein RadA/Sms
VKLKAVYRCQECGFASPKWGGQCTDCGAWNSLVEEAVVAPSATTGGRSAPRPLTDFSSEIVALKEAAADRQTRIAVGIEELDRMVGGGLVDGQVILLAGPPGIGKSTLMLQVADRLARSGRVLYVTGEESLGQVSGRAERLGAKAEDVFLLAETSLSKILDAVEEKDPKVLVLDSIQTVYHPELGGSPGSVGQVRECAAELLRAAKKSGRVLFILGHVTKEGSVAGPKVLEHIVDTVLQFDADSARTLRVLRASKNRFGPSSEIGLFEMREEGLVEVRDAASHFIENSDDDAAGRAVTVALEGSRPILTEVQALVTPTRYPLPRRMATGLDLNRVQVLLAALEKHCGLRLESRDVYLNVAGGLRPRDPALDLAVCMAVMSSAEERALAPDWVFVGEVGLLGRLGRVSSLDARLREAGRAGFKRALVPAAALDGLRRGGRKTGITAAGARDLAAAAAACFEDISKETER